MNYKKAMVKSRKCLFVLTRLYFVGKINIIAIVQVKVALKLDVQKIYVSLQTVDMLTLVVKNIVTGDLVLSK